MLPHLASMLKTAVHSQDEWWKGITILGTVPLQTLGRYLGWLAFPICNYTAIFSALALRELVHLRVLKLELHIPAPVLTDSKVVALS